jgi:hypothetical protein
MVGADDAQVQRKLAICSMRFVNASVAASEEPLDR